MKIRPAFEDASIPLKPQLHSRKHHHAYNGTRSLPIFTWVRPSMTTAPNLRTKSSPPPPAGALGRDDGLRTRDRYRPIRQEQQYIPIQLDTRSISSSTTSSTLTVYEVKLFYSNNRACTIYRSWDDFVSLRRGLPGRTAQPLVCPERHSHNSQCLHRFLKHVVARSPHEPAVEFFLRRRMDDCGGG